MHRKQSLSKLFTTAVSLTLLSACAGAPTFSPHRLDLQMGELQVYRVVDKKNLVIQDTGKFEPLRIGSNQSYGHGFLCVPMAEAKRWRERCLEKKCTESSFWRDIFGGN